MESLEPSYVISGTREKPSPRGNFIERLYMNIYENVVPVSPVPELSFLPNLYRGWTRAGEKRVQDNLHAHAQNAAIFSPQIGVKTLFGSTSQIRLVARFSEW